MRTLRYLFPFLLLLALAAALPATAQESLSGPEAVFLETSYKFPMVVEGIEVIHDFPVRNQGSEDLRIIKVQTT
ncbi:MAG: DUF1573 domain-containing protein [Proteobacteria bacterium]|nr:DUF1573 domain-containing protein [Pseudomonadota bacterium]